MKKLIIVLTLISITSLIIHLWIRENVKPYVKKSYENLYNKQGDRKDIAEWDFKFNLYNYPRGENANIIQDSLNINDKIPQSLKIEKIANYILSYTEGRNGTPNIKVLENKSPYNQLKLIKAGKSHIWCGLFSFYYSYFLDGADIVSRYISMEKPGDTIIGTHVITEIYIADEDKWIYSDLTFNIIYAKNAQGKLNLVELISAIKNNDDRLVFIKNDLNSGLMETSIKEMDKNYIDFMKSFSEIRYFSGQQLRNNFIPFTRSEKIFENIFPSSSYYLFADENNYTNYLLFAGSRLLMIISLIVLLVFLFLNYCKDLFPGNSSFE